MRYVVYGAGAVGGTIAAQLHESGRETLLVARGAHLAAIRSAGLRVVRADGESVLDVPVVGSYAEIEPREDDVVVLGMKTQDAIPALAELAGLVSWQTPIVCVQNGVATEQHASRWFANVYGVYVLVPAEHLEPGLIRSLGVPTPGGLDIGRFPAGVDETAIAIAADLTAAGFVSTPERAVMRYKYRKLMTNLHNSIEALLGVRQGRNSEVAERARAEASAVFAAAGIAVASDEEDVAKRGAAITPTVTKDRNGSSTWQSVVRNTGSVETDYLNGEIVMLGRQLGIPTPVNLAIQQAMRDMLRRGDQPGAMSLEQLAALAGVPA